MHRFFALPDPEIPGTVLLSGEDSHHALNVLRLKPGDAIEVIFNGSIWSAEILSADHQAIRAGKMTPMPDTEPKLSVTLIQGIPKSDRMDLIVQKSTELGVSRILPVIMERCVSRPDMHDTGKKLERWQKIAREAAKQAGRSIVPEILSPLPLYGLSSLESLPETRIVPWEESLSYGPLAFSRDHPSISRLGILIGPEGGITPGEIDWLREQGFIPVTLGKRILRTETAGPAAVAAVMSLYGEMDRL